MRRLTLLLFMLLVGSTNVFSQQVTVNIPQGSQSSQPSQASATTQSGTPGGSKLVMPPANDGLPPEVFSEIVSQQRPLSPDQIKELRVLKEHLDRATAKRPYGMPKPQSSTVSIDFSHEKIIPPVRLDIGIVTSLVFVDSTGSPWPIVDFAVGDREAIFFPDQKMVAEKKMNILTISPRDTIISTNLSVLLEGAPAPIVITVLSGQKYVDYRIDFIVAGHGPKYQKPIIDSGFSESIPTDLIMALDGKPNENAIELTVEGDQETRVWKVGKTLIVRTKLTITAPAAIRMGQSVDNIKAYEIPETPYLLALRNGELISLKINGL